MAVVVVSPRAARALGELIVTHTLPSDTTQRVLARIQPLGAFPLLGRGLRGRLAGVRFIFGPWRWMVILYEFDAARDIVRILTIADARAFDAATNYRT